MLLQLSLLLTDVLIAESFYAFLVVLLQHFWHLLWFNPTQKLSTTQPLAQFPTPTPSGMGDRVKKKSKTCGLR